MKIAVVSGGFDPLHSGHLRLFTDASEMGDRLVVCLNSDDWLQRKKGSPFMPFDERRKILLALEVVDDVVEFDDSDGSCREGLKQIKEWYPSISDSIIFCNGGDRLGNNIPEKDVEGINFVYGVGGYSKTNSSSKILQIIKKRWGKYRVLFQNENTKVKELIIEPGKGISYQRHFKRSEIWFISKGRCTVKYAKTDKDEYAVHELQEDDVFTVRKNEWHQITNDHFFPCHIIEIQYGDEMSELDIERDEDIL
jgi:D-beta-D-heptose 7-phosphate kinase/D-beta-D-heptose 1-phosphate adenosyltransferase